MPIKPIQIAEPGSEPPAKAADRELAAEDIRIRPTHDTGSIWDMVLSFLLPILGLVGMFLFQKFHHMRNYRACRKGTVAGFIFLAAVLAIFLLLLLLMVV